MSVRKFKAGESTGKIYAGNAKPASLMPRIFPVKELFDRSGDDIRLDANEAEREAISQAFDLHSVSSLNATLRVGREGKVLHLTGRVEALVCQICGVTLDAFEATVSEPVDVRLTDDPDLLVSPDEIAIGNEADWQDPPDPLTGGELDLGALAVEHFVLGLDLYPRKPGAVLTIDSPEGSDPDIGSPFSALLELKTLGKKTLGNK